MKERIFSEWHVVAIPLAIYAIHASFFREWIVDDAGISFAYARNLAEGYGLVSQPGSTPIEGFSNFLWTMILVPFFALGVFHPVAVPKILGLLFVGASYATLNKGLRTLTDTDTTSILIVLTLISANTAFVVWTTSGLENSVTVFLLSMLVLLTLKSCRGARRRFLLASAMGALATGLTLTRPDGIIFFLVFPISLVLIRVFAGQSITRSHWGAIGIYSAVFAATLGAFLVFRVSYFGDIFPNTYYAKDGPNLEKVLSVLTLEPWVTARLIELMGSVAGRWGTYVLLGLIVLSALGFQTRSLGNGHVILLLFLLASVASYLLLPPDWMKEYRFATGFIVLFYSYSVLVVGQTLMRNPQRTKLRHASVAVLVCMLLGLCALDSVQRSATFLQEPVVDFRWVAERYGKKLNNFADALDLKDGSALLADIGGALYCSRIRIHDLAGLCDKTIARTLRRSNGAFRDYVFHELRPTFIHTHGYWTLAARFFNDGRFSRDYVPIDENVDEWIMQKTGQQLRSGTYVRREVVERDPGALARLKAIR